MQPGSPSAPPAEAAAPQSLWRELRDAIRGTNADYTRIPLRRAVFLLAVPMVLELVLESTFAVVDIFFVAKLGPSAVATVGLTESYLFLLYSVAMGLAMAVTAVIARRIGEGKPEEAAVTAVQAIIVALRERFPDIEGPRKDDICYATQNRQDAVRRLAEAVDLVLVVGSVNSSNSNRLRELAEKQGVRSYLIDGAEHIDRDWLEGVQRIGVTAGASAPDKLVRDVISRLQSWGAGQVSELDGEPENITFALPKELRMADNQSGI